MKKQSIFALFSAILLTSACANPVVVSKVGPEDYSKSCAELEQDINQTRHLRSAAREDDEFQWRYIFVVNGLWSMYQINKAEKAANERLDELQRLYGTQGCAQQGAAPVADIEQQPMAAPAAEPQL